jgi:hypothetical protein
VRSLVRWHSARSAAPVGPFVAFAAAFAIAGAWLPVPGIEASSPSTTSRSAALTTAWIQPATTLVTASSDVAPVPGEMSGAGLPAWPLAAAEIDQPDVNGPVEDVPTFYPLNVRLAGEITSPSPVLSIPERGAEAASTAELPRHRVSWRVAPIVTWYGPGFYGHGTACGLKYTRVIIGVAHRTLPCGTLVEFQWHGMTAVAPVIDRGPYASKAYVFDWSAAMACHVFRPHGVSNSCYTRHDVKWRVVGKVKLGRWMAQHSSHHKHH